MAVLHPPDPVYNLRQSNMGPVNCLCFHNADSLYCGTANGFVYLYNLQVCCFFYFTWLEYIFLPNLSVVL